MRKPCCDKEGTNKGAWSKQEDQKLIDYIRAHGEGCWRSLPKAAGLHRCGKSCRLRWINYLRPDIKRGNFGPDEEDLIIKLHALLGNRWSLIAGRLPGRTDNEVKNYWNSHIRRKLIKMGIDPNNHKLHHSINDVNNNPRVVSVDDATESSSSSGGSMTKQVLVQDQHYTDTSCLEQESRTPTTPSSHHHHHQLINLDLSIAFPNSPSSIIQDQKLPNYPNTTSYPPPPHHITESAPTLLLFR